MLTVFLQISVLYIFLLLGWFFGRIKKGLAEQTGLLSFLLVSLLLPCKIFSSFSKNFTLSYITESYGIICISLCFLAAFSLLSVPLSKMLTKDEYGRRVFQYSLTVSNYAYLGYVLAEELLGETGLTSLILFCIPCAIYTYSVGYVLLTGKDKSFKRVINPMTVAILVGCIFGLLQIPLPKVVGQVVSSSSACVGPLGMLLTGITLSSFDPRALLLDKKVYAFSLLRLIVLPAAVFAVCKLLSLDAVLPYVLIVACMPCGLNTIIFPKLIGEDCTLGARLAFISHLFSCITLPFWLSMII